MLRVKMALLSMAALTGCLAGAGALAPCDPLSTDSAICHLTNPEDLAFLLDHSWILVSEMAPNERGSAEEPEVADGDEGTERAQRNAGASDRRAKRGRLSAIRLSDFDLRSLYPVESLGALDPADPANRHRPVGPVGCRCMWENGWPTRRPQHQRCLV